MYLFCRNPRRKEAVLFDVLPTLIEEFSTLDDVSDEHSGDGANMTENQDLVSHNEQEPVIRKMVSAFFNSISKSHNSSC